MEDVGVVLQLVLVLDSREGTAAVLTCQAGGQAPTP
jgi:hypothetical protein